MWKWSIFCFLACFICQFSSITGPVVASHQKLGGAFLTVPLLTFILGSLWIMRTPESIILSLRCRLSLSPSLNRNFLVVQIMNDFLISLFPLLPSSHYISIYTSFHRSLLNAFPLCRIRLLSLSTTNCRYLSLSHQQIFPIHRNTGSHSQRVIAL